MVKFTIEEQARKSFITKSVEPVARRYGDQRNTIMKLTQVRLSNLGRFKALDVSFAPTQSIRSNVTVLIGTNGGGKTTILRALATSLSWFGARVRSEKGSGSPISEENILNGTTSAAIALSVHDQRDYNWTITKSRPGKKSDHITQLSEVSHLADNYRNILSSDAQHSLPLIAFYPVERSVLDIPLKIRGRHSFSQLDGYENSLNQGIDFRRFFEWFREREDIENEMAKPLAFSALSKQDPERIARLYKLADTASERIDKIEFGDIKSISKELKDLFNAFKLVEEIESLSKDRQLDAVRTAIAKFMPDFTNLRVRRKPKLYMSIDKKGEALNVSQLSQGEKSLMALVGDIARRLAMLNPKLDNPLLGLGIVLIDEVDMHLHPQWARAIIERLTDTFPNCQFILTTHSPLVISDFRDVLIYSLDNGELVNVPSLYGQDANTVLLEVMDTHIRNANVEKRFGDLLDSIQDRNLDKAKALFDKLEKELPPSNLELAKARLLLKKEILRRAED